MDNYNIAFNSNENYIPYLSVLITSIVYSAKNVDSPFCFHLLIDKVSKDTQEKLESLILQLSTIYPCSLEIYIISDDMFANYDIPKLNGNYLAYYRLLIGSVLNKISDVLYLDVDMLCVCDIREIFSYLEIIRQKELVCGVVYDYIDLNRKLISKNNEFSGMFGDYGIEYFNSGMLLVDLKSWRELNIEEKSFKIVQNYVLKEHDQSILNATLLHKTLKLPLKYNLLVYLYINANTLECKKSNVAYTKEELNDALNNPCILHFYTYHKPWIDSKVYVDCKDNFLGHYWWDMARKTPIFCNELENIKSLADYNKGFQTSLGYMLYKITIIFFVFAIVLVPIVTYVCISFNKTPKNQVPNNLYNLSYEIGRACIYAHKNRKKGKYFSLVFKILNIIKRNSIL